MKKLCILAAVLCLGLIPQYGAAAGIQDLDTNHNGIYEPGEVDPCCEYQTGPCVCDCPYTKFKPCYYYTTRCVQEPYCVQKKCRRYVPQYYEVTKCRYVPQYYTVQCCRQVPEDYCVDETRYCTKQVKDCHCKYVPYTYHKQCCYWPDQCQQQCQPGCQAGCSTGYGYNQSGYNQPGYNQPGYNSGHNNQNYQK